MPAINFWNAPTSISPRSLLGLSSPLAALANSSEQLRSTVLTAFAGSVRDLAQLPGPLFAASAANLVGTEKLAWLAVCLVKRTGMTGLVFVLGCYGRALWTDAMESSLFMNGCS